MKTEIEKYLAYATDQFDILSDNLLTAGAKWADELATLRNAADVFLLLISEYYLSSPTVKEQELPHILTRGKSDPVYIIPLILEKCDWQNRQFSVYQALPKFGKPITEYKVREEAYAEIKNSLLSIRQVKFNSKAIQLIREAKSSRNEVLRLNECNLETVPRDLLEMPWLKELYLDKNFVKTIENLDNLIPLERLSLVSNEIERIDNLQNLVNLQFLDFEYNKLSSIGNLENNTKLTVLGLSSNAIENLKGISHLARLRTLYVGHNRLKSVQELADLPQLDRISLTNNQISSIKPLLGHIRNGLKVALHYAYQEDEKGIFIKDNPTLSEPSVEVIQLGRDAVLKYFGDAKTYGTRKLEIVKLILVGNSGVGKTNFSEFLRGRVISPTHNSTHLLDIQPWDASFLKSESGSPMRVNIFDFGGQDYYHDSHRMYYSHDTAYILLWDTATNKYSEELENVVNGEAKTTLKYENFPLEYWLESIKFNLMDKYQPDYDSGSRDPSKTKKMSNTAPVLILQNKIDIAEGMLDQRNLVQKYENITHFFNVSLKSKKRTTILFDVLSDYMYSMNLAGRQLIAYEFRIIEDYLSRPRSFSILTLEEFRDECVDLIHDPGIDFNTDNALIIAEILNSIGVVFYSSSENGGLVYTNISRLNELIKEVMDIAKKGNVRGIFKADHLEHIEHVEKVLKLLIQNKSVIAINEIEYLAPQFLPVVPEPPIAFFLPAFVYHQVRFLYKAYFHKSLLLSLFSEYLSGTLSGTNAQISSLPFWRNGIIISEGEGVSKKMVYVEFEKTESMGVIKLRTMAPYSKTGLERRVEASIGKLSQGWSYTKEISINGTDFFDEDELKGKAAVGQYEFASENGRVFGVNDFKHIVDFEKLPKKLFISYSSRNAEYIKRFVIHLEILKSNGLIDPWYDRMIESGTKWDDSIRAEMKNSDIIIFLLSPDFLATEYIMKTEIPLAIKQLEDQKSKFFFVELQPCGWKRTEIAQFQQTDDSAEAGKNVILIETANNDAKWNRLIDELVIKMQE